MPTTGPPVTLETARRLAAYNEAAFQRFARAAHRLPWRQVTANHQTGHLSIFRTLVHILNVHDVWLLYIVQGRTGELDQLFHASYRRPKNWAGFDSYSRQVWRGIRDYFTRLTPTGLRKRVKAPWMPGTYTVGDAVL